jgi:ABC-type transport system substrate-binding protein
LFDTMLDWLPPVDYTRISADAALAVYLVPLGAFPHVSYITLVWQEEPLNNPMVRQALSLAIDRERLAQILNNRAVVPNGPLNPSVPGDNADLPPWLMIPIRLKHCSPKLVSTASRPPVLTMAATSRLRSR